MKDFNLAQEIKNQIERLTPILPDWSEEEIRQHALKMASKYLTVKSGDNVIHLEYYSGIIMDDDIKQIENDLSNVNIELSRFDKSGVPYASLEDYTLDIMLFISGPIMQGILLNIGSSAAWDGIKSSFSILWKKVRRRNPPPSGRNISCGMEVKIGAHASIRLKFEGEGADEEMQESLDKILDTIRTVIAADITRNNNFFIYDKKIKNWVALDRMKEMARKIEKRKKNH